MYLSNGFKSATKLHTFGDAALIFARLYFILIFFQDFYSYDHFGTQSGYIIRILYILYRIVMYIVITELDSFNSFQTRSKRVATFFFFLLKTTKQQPSFVKLYINIKQYSTGVPLRIQFRWIPNNNLSLY